MAAKTIVGLTVPKRIPQGIWAMVSEYILWPKRRRRSPTAWCIKDAREKLFESVWPWKWYANKVFEEEKRDQEDLEEEFEGVVKEGGPFLCAEDGIVDVDRWEGLW